MYSTIVIQWVIYFYIYCFTGSVWETCYVIERNEKKLIKVFKLKEKI